MSLSHSIRWYQRRQSRQPDLAAWPEFTWFTATDVLAAGESMVTAAVATGTPSVRIGRRRTLAETGAAAGPTHPEGGSPAYCAIVVCAVEGVFDGRPDESVAAEGAGRTDAPHPREVWLDAELDACRPIGSTMRVIGRTVPPVREIVTVRPTSRVEETRAWLPHDIRAGDLVAFACAEPVSLQDLRRRAHHPERLDDGRWS
ncbi:hypothetical protein [Herbiconiux ginsengi]|uniref:Uncharacterized protein n=1 Tax=Herbiconiux ginsengi TaxID=381665 RepID=A0A1H3LAL0_9MICO|nr:hypothetical protein [Herbiconiux ginsengi]SDY61326.1 hypothetical protein SAMN05216554_0895 [Herbiconiux ginsengi]